MPVMRCLARRHPDICNFVVLRYFLWFCVLVDYGNDGKMFSFPVMSEDMVKDGYEDIMNIDISSVAIDMMISKYEHIPQLKCILLEIYFIKISRTTFNCFFISNYWRL